LKGFNDFIRRFFGVAMLRAVSVLGIFASSFYITSTYGISEFGRFSFVFAVSSLILVISRFGCEYSVFKGFFDKYQVNEKSAFGDLQIVVALSFFVSFSLCVLSVLLLSIEEEYLYMFVVHTLVFSIIQPLSLALRAVSRFKESYIIDVGSYWLLITGVWAVFGYVSDMHYIEVSVPFYLTYFLIVFIVFRKELGGMNLRFALLYRCALDNVHFLVYSLSEYLCFWAVLLVSGFLLNSTEVGYISWGGRIFQLFVFFIGVRNSIIVPEILKSDNGFVMFKYRMRESLVYASSIVVFVGIITSILGFIYGAYVREYFTPALLALLFFFASCIRMAFGPVSHIFSRYADIKDVFINLLMISFLCVVGGFAIYHGGVLYAGVLYLVIWLASLTYLYYVANKKMGAE